MSTPQPTSIARRHDLDALRAIAMLLGIALHAALSFIAMPEGAWPVQDAKTSEVFNLFLAAVHGFRMPLFFLVSGFFTAMLWRKRGLLALLEHRFMRIALPLFIGMFTIVPAVWVVSIRAGIAGSETTDRSAEANIFTAVKSGDLDAITKHLDSGVDPNATEPSTGATPLALATWNNEVDAITLLIDRGADANARSRDGSTPLHGAAMFGQSDAAEALLERGADRGAVNRNGESVAETLRTGWSKTQIVASLMKVPADWEQIKNGRARIASSIGVESSAGEELGSGVINEQWAGILLLLTFFPVFHHLWFLWFLCWLVGAFAIYAKAAEIFNWKASGRLIVSPLRYLWLIPLTILPQSTMGLLYPNFGPDTSAGLIPMPNILLYYMIFFFFGALYFDCDDQQGQLGRRWRVTLPLALLIVFPVGYDLTQGGIGLFSDALDYRYHRPIAVLLQVLYVWLMTFGLMGFFRQMHSGESKAMRYISDSSYWLYLAHLPLLIVAQAIVRDWQMPTLAKFSLITIVCSALLLLSYQWCVRYTPIGTLLNGPRKRPGPPVDAILVEPSGAQN